MGYRVFGDTRSGQSRHMRPPELAILETYRRGAVAGDPVSEVPPCLGAQYRPKALNRLSQQVHAWRVVYVDLLALAASEMQREDWEGHALFEVVVATSARLRDPRAQTGRSVAETLALELSHDRALIAFCNLMGISTEVEDFEVPTKARERLEGELEALHPEWCELIRTDEAGTR